MEKLLTTYLENINPMIVFVSFIILVLIGWIIIKNRKVISEFFNDLYNRKKNKEEILQTIKDNQSNIKTIMENRINDREQSFTNQLPRCKHSSTVSGSYVASHSTCLFRSLCSLKSGVCELVCSYLYS